MISAQKLKLTSKSKWYDSPSFQLRLRNLLLKYLKTNYTQKTIIDLPTEILWIIANFPNAQEMSAPARANWKFYPKLQLALIKHNITHQSSSALH